jgi:predicted secreted hydrolase
MMWRRLCVLLCCAATFGCDRPPPSATDGGSQVRLEQRMAAAPDPGFARAIEPRSFVFPQDHGPHPAFATEWWYLTGNLEDAQGRAFGYQLTLFRVGLEPGQPAADSAWRTHQIYMGHLALSDIAERRHHSAERFSRAAVGLAGAESVPLRVWLGPWAIEGGADDLFPLRLDAAADGLAIELELTAGDKPLVLQGERGLSRKSAAPGNASYYYSYTRLPTTGAVRIDGRQYRVNGDSWLDREWSSSALAADQAGWDWFALQLEDGRDLMFYRMRGRDGQAQRFSKGVLVAADGSAEALTLEDVTLEPTRRWRSADGVDYPVAWRLAVPGHGLDLEVEAAFDDQEMDHTVRYWEGAVVVRGSQRGVGYLELSGYAP